jgi:agmatinase
VDPLKELALLLRPAGGGLYLVSTGRAEQLALQKRLYGVGTEQEVQVAFQRALSAIPSARVVLLAVPSDVGAGFLRGANLGPQAIRTELLESDPDWPARSAAAGVVDVGDVFVVPQLLHDEMLAPEQRRASARALYPSLPEDEAVKLPVSPLSICERALDLIFQLNPSVAPFVIGGDHSCAWPVAAAVGRVQKPGSWGIVQPDAHTDLLAERLGVKYCFATWSYHANELLGRSGRLVQVGTRASRHARGHWESTLGVRQFWAEECRARPKQALDDLIAHLHATGVRAIYFSNDIDGTDDAHADATGTPEPGGLEPEFVVELIRRLGREFIVLAGDVMEVAPPIPRKPGGTERTVRLAVRYLRETLAAMLGSPV